MAHKLEYGILARSRSTILRWKLSLGDNLKSMIAFAACLTLCFATSAEAETLSFRGLDSSSRKADVLRVFPSADAESDCRPGEEFARSSEGLTQCEVLRVDYELDGLVFDGTFMFSPEGTLRYVALTRSFGWGRSEAGTVRRATAESAFQSLADLFASKYGPSVRGSPSSLLPSNPLRQTLEWQPGRGTAWQSGGDRISLTSDLRESPTTPGMFRGSMQVFYTFARRGEFDRF